MPQNKITYSDMPEVSFFTAGTQTYGVSGDTSGTGATVVEGTYYHWESAESGFTNTYWWGTEVSDGPTAQFGFKQDSEVTAYINEHGDLDAVFANWQTYINGLESWEQHMVVGAFGQKLSEEGGADCMESV